MLSNFNFYSNVSIQLENYEKDVAAGNMEKEMPCCQKDQSCLLWFAVTCQATAEDKMQGPHDARHTSLAQHRCINYT